MINIYDEWNVEYNEQESNIKYKFSKVLNYSNFITIDGFRNCIISKDISVNIDNNLITITEMSENIEDCTVLFILFNMINNMYTFDVYGEFYVNKESVYQDAIQLALWYNKFLNLYNHVFSVLDNISNELSKRNDISFKLQQRRHNILDEFYCEITEFLDSITKSNSIYPSVKNYLLYYAYNNSDCQYCYAIRFPGKTVGYILLDSDYIVKEIRIYERCFGMYTAGEEINKVLSKYIGNKIERLVDNNDDKL